MVILGEAYDRAWKKLKDEIGFMPQYATRYESSYFPPFQISKPYVIFAIEDMTDEDNVMDKLIWQAFINCTAKGEKMYAFDWHHSAFLFDPRNPEERKDERVNDSLYIGGGYHAYFPDFYPDGDYYFFTAEDMRFGYLAHPWRNEVWVFGETLIFEFNSFYKRLGWKKIPLYGCCVPERIKRHPLL